jgi:multidrug efflux system membrane fusion protein
MFQFRPPQPQETDRVKRANALVWVVVIAAAGAALWKLSGHDFTGAPKGPPPPAAAVPVVAGAAQARNVPVYVRGLGTVQAFQTVTVRTRVDGQITKVLFDEGQEVKAGDPLFQIDQRPLKAALEQAQANKEKDQAQLQSAQLDLDRYSKLLPSGFQTRQQYDQQKGTVGQLQASVKADQAQIDSAQLNLDYSTIRAPIAGRTGQRMVDIGNYVQTTQNATLVTVTQMKPIFASFTAPADRLDDIRSYQAQAPLKVIAYAMDNKTQLAEGELTLVDNQVDQATGTIHLKAQFANGDERLWPGEFVAMRIVLSMRRNVVTLPAETVMQGPKGSYVYVLDQDGTAHRHDVEVAATQDGRAVITKGIEAGDQIVLNGQYRLTEGAKAKVVEPQQADLGRPAQ